MTSHFKIYHYDQKNPIPMQAKLDEQAKEMEALRGFANCLVKKYKTVKENGCDKQLTVLVIAKEFKLIDEFDNPTKLLTGAKDE